MSERDNLLVDLYEEGRITEKEFSLLFQTNGYVIEANVKYVFDVTWNY